MEENKDENNSIKKTAPNFPKEKSLSPVTLRDMILFKEDILKEMKIYESQTNISILKNFEKYNKLLEECNDKLYNYQRDNALFMRQLSFIEEKNKIMSLIEENNAEIKNKLMVNDFHIKNCQKELDDSCFKYDKVIVDNLLIPGLVGKGCKFLYFKEYINDIQSQINNAISQNKQNANNLNANKTTMDGQIKQLNTKIKKIEYDSKQFTTEKAIFLDNKYNQIIETLNNTITNITGEYFKSNIELKNKITEVKNIASSLIEENRKINLTTLVEFEKIKKKFKKIKKSIVELSALLTQGAAYTGKGKYNRNIANNRQLIIQQFNSMIIGLMKDVTKEKTELNNEINNVLFPKKKVGSLIKKYIEGKIHAEDTKYEEKEKNKRFGNNRPYFDIVNRQSANKKKIESFGKNEDLIINSSKLVTDVNKMGNNNKTFNRRLSVEFKDNENKNNVETINNIGTGLKLKNIFDDNNKGSQIHIIKEEKNNKSKSSNDSIFDDSDDDINIEENDNIIRNKIYSKYYNDKSNILNLKTETSPPKNDKRKLFFRAATSNFDNKIFNNNLRNSNNGDNFKLLLKAQESVTRKYEKKATLKTENQSKSIDKNKKDEIKNLYKNETPEIKIIKENKDQNYEKNKTEAIDYKTIEIIKSEKKTIFDINKKEGDKNEDYNNNKNTDNNIKNMDNNIKKIDNNNKNMDNNKKNLDNNKNIVNNNNKNIDNNSKNIDNNSKNIDNNNNKNIDNNNKNIDNNNKNADKNYKNADNNYKNIENNNKNIDNSNKNADNNNKNIDNSNKNADINNKNIDNSNKNADINNKNIDNSNKNTNINNKNIDNSNKNVDNNNKNIDNSNKNADINNKNIDNNNNDNEEKEEETKKKIEDTNKDFNEEYIKTINIKKEEKSIINNEKQNKTIINDYTSPISIRSKNLIQVKSNIPKPRLTQTSKISRIPKNNFSPEGVMLKFSKNSNSTNKNSNNITTKKENILSFNGNFNNKLLNSTNHNPIHDNINTHNNNYNKNNRINSTNKKRPLSIMSSCQTRPVSKYRIKKNYQIFDEDIFINRNAIKTLNYCRDEDIIDKPLIINQTDFKVDNLKGSLENKLLELEYFTKRKFDELVKEIKNFIPIHFNAYIKE